MFPSSHIKGLMADIELSKERISALKSEILMAEKLNDEELKPIVVEAIERYTGKHIPYFGNSWDICLNEVFPVIQNNLPAIFFRNPRAFLKPKNKTYIAKKRNPETLQLEEVQVDAQKSATTQEAIINYQLVEIKYKNETRKVLLDALLFPHGVMWHSYKGDFGMTEEASITVKNEKVFARRVSPMRFLKDPSVTFTDMDEGRWVGRSIDMRLEDLKEDERLDVSKELKGKPGFGTKIGTKTFLDTGRNGKDIQDIHKKDLLTFAGDDFKKSSSSMFVKVYEIFLRPTNKEARQGSNGWILLLTDEQEQPLRVSPWKIKAEGFPAKLLQFNQVPDSMFAIADIDTYKSIADQKNIITNLQIRNAQENTKVWVGISKGANSEEDIEKIVQGDNTIIIFDDDSKPSDRMYVASPGGQASSELYLIDQRIQKNLEDKSGVSDLKRGFLQSGEESAASVKIRAAGSSARPAYRQDIMADFLLESIHYLIQLNKQFVPYKDAVRIIGSLDLEWSEDYSKEDIQADVDVEIDVISMVPENPEQELAAFTQTLQMMVEGIRDPSIANKLAQEGKTVSLSPLIEQILIRQKIRNPEIFRNIKPEESMGFVSVAELRAAEANVQAALTNQAPPSPPEEGQDHRARLEVYGSIKRLLDQAGQISDMLEQLIQVQAALMQKEDQEAKPGKPVNLSKGGVQSV